MNVLIVEDDPSVARFLKQAANEAGYVTQVEADGLQALRLAQSINFDLILLDVMLPGLDGIEVCKRLRGSGVQSLILMITARDTTEDKVAGLDAGADDYVAKPFHMEELLARIRALLRRAAGHARNEMECGPLRLDTKTARVTVDGHAVKLTSHEYRVLAYLMLHKGRVVSRTELVEHLYEQDFELVEALRADLVREQRRYG